MPRSNSRPNVSEGYEVPTELPGSTGTNDLIVLHPSGIFIFIFLFFSEKNSVCRDRTHVPTCQRLHGTSELQGRPASKKMRGWYKFAQLVANRHDHVCFGLYSPCFFPSRSGILGLATNALNVLHLTVYPSPYSCMVRCYYYRHQYYPLTVIKEKFIVVMLG